MKKLVIVSAIAACLGFAVPTFAASSNHDNTMEYLYIQSSKSASLEPIKGSSNTYTLTLKNVHPYVVCFSERPHRLEGSVSIKQFVHEWLHPKSTTKNNFKEDAPNADLNGVKQAGQEPVNIPMELTDPQYNEHTKTLTYKVTSLKGSEKLSAMQLQYTTLVIDDYCTNCPP